EYEGYYCVSCESFFTQSQLINQQCCTDCGNETRLLKEESYFFRLSKYEKNILKWYESEPIVPKNKKAELVNFIENGLKDLSIARTSFEWGIKIPSNLNEDKHIIYGWLDALFIYISSLERDEKSEN
uniref:class I tRNA ligase family protein n=1 Tax=Klebsiella pneumoniae TaxID=573 RepID=UPI001968F2AB